MPAYPTYPPTAEEAAANGRGGGGVDTKYGGGGDDDGDELTAFPAPPKQIKQKKSGKKGKKGSTGSIALLGGLFKTRAPPVPSVAASIASAAVDVPAAAMPPDDTAALSQQQQGQTSLGRARLKDRRRSGGATKFKLQQRPQQLLDDLGEPRRGSSPAFPSPEPAGGSTSSSTSSAHRGSSTASLVDIDMPADLELVRSGGSITSVDTVNNVFMLPTASASVSGRLHSVDLGLVTRHDAVGGRMNSVDLSGNVGLTLTLADDDDDDDPKRTAASEL